jgi:predicted secreted protein
MWSHARTEARVVARDTAALVARSGVAPADAQASARSILEADTDLRNVVVVATNSTGVVTVVVTADAPGIIRGTSVPVSVTSAVPVEEITP